MAQNNVRTGQPEDFMRIQDLFYLCLSKWYWFVISLGITLSVAILMYWLLLRFICGRRLC